MRYRPQANTLARSGIKWICAGALILILTFVPFKLLLAAGALVLIAVGIRICSKNN